MPPIVTISTCIFLRVRPSFANCSNMAGMLLPKVRLLPINRIFNGGFAARDRVVVMHNNRHRRIDFFIDPKTLGVDGLLLKVGKLADVGF